MTNIISIIGFLQNALSRAGKTFKPWTKLLANIEFRIFRQTVNLLKEQQDQVLLQCTYESIQS